MNALLALLTLNPVLQFNHVPAKFCRVQDMPLVSCCKVAGVVPINSAEHLMNEGIPVFPYRCIPGSSLHA